MAVFAELSKRKRNIFTIERGDYVYNFCIRCVCIEYYAILIDLETLISLLCELFCPKYVAMSYYLLSKENGPKNGSLLLYSVQ